MLLAVRLRRCLLALLVGLWAVGALPADIAAATTLPAPVHSAGQDCPTPRATAVMVGSLEVRVQLAGGVGAVQPGRSPGPPRVLGPIAGAAVQVLDMQTPAQVVAEQLTDAQGLATFVLPPDRYTVWVLQSDQAPGLTGAVPRAVAPDGRLVFAQDAADVAAGTTTGLVITIAPPAP